MKRRVLLKIGGQAFQDRKGYEALASALLAATEAAFVIVHGGGAEISEALKAARREFNFIDGIRITRAEDIAIVEDVLSNTVNARIAEYLTEAGLATCRMSGKTDALLLAEPLRRGGHDYGFVGQIKTVNPAPIERACKKGLTPVVSPISADAQSQSYNVNADTAAAALAVGARCSDLVYFTDVPGVRTAEAPCPVLTVQAAKALITNGTVTGGMVAKLESAFDAIAGGVERVHIVQWVGPETLPQVLAGSCVSGTTINV